MAEAPKSAKAELLERGLAPKKSFGQNFMLDQHINEGFAEAVVQFWRGMPVVEIGAGTGSLTDHLLRSAPVVHAVERDRDLVPILAVRFADVINAKKLVLHEADGARFDLSQCLNAEQQGVLVGNLPYHLTSAILFLAIRQAPLLKGAVFMVQKEVADRLCASPNNKQYGFLTVVLNILFEIDIVKKVDRNCFWPVPRVDSAIVRLKKRETQVLGAAQIEEFIIFVREIFQKRRKKLSTILGSFLTSVDFKSLDIDANLRPENLDPKEFASLFSLAVDRSYFLRPARLQEKPPGL